MPWRLIGLVLLLFVFLVFIGLNQSNLCEISFGFWKTQSIPVYLPIFAGFVLGLLCSIPFVVSLGIKNSRKRQAGQAGGSSGALKKRGISKGNPLSGDLPYDDFPSGGNDGPYGID